MEHIILIKPEEKYESQVMNAREDILNLNEHFDGCEGLEDVSTYAEWLDFENRLKVRYGDGYVPSDIYLAVTEDTDTVVGIIDFRHYLSDFLLQYGGHIGYSVVPSQRRKGYGTEMLKVMLEKLKVRGEKRLLLCVDKENTPSVKIITKNGGILENEVEDGAGFTDSGIIQRYWIEL